MRNWEYIVILKVGNKRVDTIVGPWGIGEANERGEELIEWCKANDFMISNTWFQNHPRRQWTWKSPGDNVRNKIDFILVENRFKNAVKASKSMPGADCDSDHVPVVCKFQVKLKRRKQAISKPKYQIDLLKSDNQLKEEFSVEIKNRFEKLSEITEVEELWQKMKNSLNEVMEEKIPKTDKKAHKKWINLEILQLMEERRKATLNKELYKELNKQVKRKCNEAKERWINEQCQEIEEKYNIDSKYVHGKIKEIKGNKGCTTTSCIKSKDGNMLMEKEDVLNRWSEYVEELFKDNRGKKPAIKKVIGGPIILKEEVEQALRKMKHGKATGPDNIPIEVIATLHEIGIEMLTKLLNMIYDSGTIPDDMKKSVFITLPKTPGATECENHRTISLMSHCTKLLLRILLGRMRRNLRPEISKAQFGFVPDKGTRNAIFTLSMLVERCVEVQRDIYLCFIDYSKAFDKVKHEELFNMLAALDTDGKDLRLVRNLYWEQEAAVRIGGEHSQYKPIKRGVRQGCVMSPDLFNFYSENILRNLDNSAGLRVNGETINNIRYADDTVLIAESETDLQKLLDITVEESDKLGLSLNVKKTECMVVTKKKIIPACNLVSNNHTIKQVSKFKYLGYMITSDGRCTTEVKKRIAMAKDAFRNLSPILKNRNILMQTKLRVLKSYVWSMLFYGCESWTITKQIEKRLEAAEMWFIRRMMRISWTEMKTNEQVLAEAGVERSVIKCIRDRQMKFIGHICRRRELEYVSIMRKIEGKRGRRRHRMTYIDSLNSWATGKTMSNVGFLMLSDNRDEWKCMAADVCSRSGT